MSNDSDLTRQSDPGRDQVHALLSLISGAAHDAMEEYAKIGAPVPSTSDTHLNPLDTLMDVVALKKAIRILDGACEQLCASLAQPMHTMFNRSAMSDPHFLQIVMEHKIADVLADHPKGLHISEIVKQLPNPINAGKLARILRCLATRHCFTEVADDVFANNRLSLTLKDSDATSAIVGFMSNECRQASYTLPQALASPGWDQSAFAYSIKEDIGGESLWNWFMSHPKEGRRFDRAMIAVSNTIGGLAGITAYPWDKLAPGSSVCDIGSGIGSFSVPLAKAHPHLKVTLQDLPGPLDNARKTIESESGPDKSSLMDRVSFVPLDFFLDSPLPDQDVYYMRHILHDWTDEQNLVILGNIRKAMKNDSRLLIHDYLMPSLDSEDPPADGSPSSQLTRREIRVDKAPYPLLHNFGAGNFRMYSQDMTMLTVLNSQERTLKHIKQLASKVDLKATGIWELAEQHILELRPVEWENSLD